jgi:hypothetical protein
MIRIEETRIFGPTPSLNILIGKSILSQVDQLAEILLI